VPSQGKAEMLMYDHPMHVKAGREVVDHKTDEQSD
jgi:hypothetical protein